MLSEIMQAQRNIKTWRDNVKGGHNNTRQTLIMLMTENNWEQQWNNWMQVLKDTRHQNEIIHCMAVGGVKDI